ncbi:MAG: hypothetical protein P8Y44_11515 [Acidobacteriota bacterium]
MISRREAIGSASLWFYAIALAAILLVGAFLRIYALAEPSLWHDEIYHILAAERARDEPLRHWLTGLDVDRENGPLYYATQLLTSRLVAGELGVRLAPALIGIATLPIMALAGYWLSGRLLSLIATLLLAVSPLHVCLSREGRPYSTLMLASCLLLIVLLRPKWRWSIPIAYATAVALAYLGAMSLPLLLGFAILAVSQLIYLRWKGRGSDESVRQRGLVRASAHFALAATIGLTLIPFLYFEFEATPQYRVDFKPVRWTLVTPSFSSGAVDRFLASMTTSGLNWVPMESRSRWLVALAAVGLFFGLLRHRRGTVLVVASFLLSSGASFAALFATGRFYAMRYTCSGLAPFLLLLGLGLVALASMLVAVIPERIRGSEFTRVAAWSSALALAMVVAVPNIAVARAQPLDKIDWRSLARMLDEGALEGEVVIASDRWPQMCLGYYLQRLGSPISIVDVSLSLETAQRLVNESNTAWLVTAGVKPAHEMRRWMHRFDHVYSQRIAELDIFFSPDFRTLIESRFAGGREEILVEGFERLGWGFDFEAPELLLQGSGWSFPEKNRQGETFQWATAPEAQLALPLITSMDRLIRFRALPLEFPEATAQTVELILNSVSLKSVELRKGWNEIEVSAPAEAWLGGPDILTLRFRRTDTPAEVLAGSNDWRSLSAAFDYLEVVPGAGS